MLAFLAGLLRGSAFNKVTLYMNWGGNASMIKWITGLLVLDRAGTQHRHVWRCTGHGIGRAASGSIRNEHRRRWGGQAQRPLGRGTGRLFRLLPHHAAYFASWVFRPETGSRNILDADGRGHSRSISCSRSLLILFLCSVPADRKDLPSCSDFRRLQP